MDKARKGSLLVILRHMQPDLPIFFEHQPDPAAFTAIEPDNRALIQVLAKCGCRLISQGAGFANVHSCVISKVLMVLSI